LSLGIEFRKQSDGHLQVVLEMSGGEVSVIIPAYNRAHCIARAVQSALEQKGVSLMEVLVGDDASTDETSSVAKALDPCVRTYRLAKNSGPAAARNRAMREAKGEFLAFLDSDDEWLAGKLAEQVRYMREHPDVGVCASSHFLQKRTGSRVVQRVPETSDWRRALHSAQSFHGASTPVVRRSLAVRTGLQDERLRVLEDWDWMLRLSMLAPVHVLPEPLAVIHENAPSNPDFTWSATELFLQKHRAEFLREGREHAKRVVSQHWENAAVNQFLHCKPKRGLVALLRSIKAAPSRNPALVAALAPALLDAVAGTELVRAAILQRRDGGR
jgi:glycosyltransferase involved in cell wall biosynthesis